MLPATVPYGFTTSLLTLFVQWNFLAVESVPLDCKICTLFPDAVAENRFASISFLFFFPLLRNKLHELKKTAYSWQDILQRWNVYTMYAQCMRSCAVYSQRCEKFPWRLRIRCVFHLADLFIFLGCFKLETIHGSHMFMHIHLCTGFDAESELYISAYPCICSNICDINTYSLNMINIETLIEIVRNYSTSSNHVETGKFWRRTTRKLEKNWKVSNYLTFLSLANLASLYWLIQHLLILLSPLNHST